MEIRLIFGETKNEIQGKIMPIITGLFRFQGSMGGVTADRNGVVRLTPRPRTITAERTRENNAEFGIASKQARVIRSALAALQIRSRFLSSKMTKKVREGIGLDETNERGKRILSKREATIVLPGMQLNERNLESVGNIIASVEANQLKVERVGGGTPLKTDFSLPFGATNVQILGLVARININPDILRVEEIRTSTSREEGEEIIFPPMAISPDANPDIITIGAVALRFYQEVNGTLYPLDDRSYDVGKIVSVV